MDGVDRGDVRGPVDVAGDYVVKGAFTGDAIVRAKASFTVKGALTAGTVDVETGGLVVAKGQVTGGLFVISDGGAVHMSGNITEPRFVMAERGSLLVAGMIWGALPGQGNVYVKPGSVLASRSGWVQLLRDGSLRSVPVGSSLTISGGFEDVLKLTPEGQFELVA